MSDSISDDVDMVDSKTKENIKQEQPHVIQTKRAGLQSRLQASKHDQSFLCVVCTDRASGYHYGVPACEGCKAFFKRSLQSKDLNYKCPASSNCTIDKMSRKCCQACRLKKCHDVGMSKEFLGNKIKRVKSDKDRQTKSRPRKSDCSESDEMVDNLLTPQEMELDNIIRSLVALHSELYLKLNLIDSTRSLRENFCHVVDQQLVHIIDWAKQLPGYCDLVISDQAILLQAGWVDLLVLNWIYHSSRRDGSIALTKTFCLNYTEAVVLGFGNIYLNILSLASRVKRYCVEEEEISCLKAISLTNAESSSLTGGDKVNDLITTYSSALQFITTNRHRNNQQKFAKLVLILPQLKYLVNQIIEFLYTMKMNESDESNLSEIVIEMLEAKQRL